MSSRSRRTSFVVLIGALALCGCKPFNPTVDSKTFEPCCNALGTCIPGGLVAEDVRGRLAQDSCATELLCVPTALAENSQAIPADCRADGDVEGRCLPSCLPDVAGLAETLVQSSCGASELCVPCFDPRDGADTEACHLGADPGPREPAKRFPYCCGGRGRCLGETFLERSAPDTDLSALSAKDCDDRRSVCVPDAWLDDDALPQACRSVGGFEGRCIPACIAETDDALGLALPRDRCESGDVCAPCYDPRSGKDTEICTRNEDKPKEPPATFAACCRLDGASQGRCVPSALLEDTMSRDDLSRLGRDNCAAGNGAAVCVPSVWLDAPNAKPATCSAVSGVEGRCLPRCLPDVAARADQLEQSSCEGSALCVPCFDPLSGEDTGACRIGDDAPEKPARTFERCCSADSSSGASGICLTQDLLGNESSEAQARLGRDSCRDADALCVPEAWVDGPPELDRCRFLGSFEGRCLPACLPEIASQSDRLRRETCDANALCAPCFDPFSGEDTGVCSISADAPSEKPNTFPTCCGKGGATYGHCVPKPTLQTLGGGNDVEQFGVESCAASESVCVPDVYLDANGAPAKTCRATGDGEGRCLSTCLPDVAAQASNLQQDLCEVSELCVPCFDPRTGTDTGACRTQGDAPSEPGRTFAQCCGVGAEARGRCLPANLLTAMSSADAAHLSADRCTEPDTLCVPEDWIDTENPTPPPVCRAAGDLEGRCLPNCLPDVMALAERLTQRGCDPGESCVPCYDPQTEVETGVCRINGDRPVETARGFASCCGTGLGAQGTCVPAEFLATDQLSGLPLDSCHTYDARCVPNDAFVAPEGERWWRSCISGLGSRGICLADCFIGSAASLLTVGNCERAERCVPCANVPASTGIEC